MSVIMTQSPAASVDLKLCFPSAAPEINTAGLFVSNFRSNRVALSQFIPVKNTGLCTSS